MQDRGAKRKQRKYQASIPSGRCAVLTDIIPICVFTRLSLSLFNLSPSSEILHTVYTLRQFSITVLYVIISDDHGLICGLQCISTQTDRRLLSRNLRQHAGFLFVVRGILLSIRVLFLHKLLDEKTKATRAF